MHCRIQKHDRTQLRTVAQRPTKGDRPTPVVRDDDNWASKIEVTGQIVEIIDPILQSALYARALRPPHLELIDSDHSHIGWRLIDQVAPHVRPRGVAMDTKHGDPYMLTPRMGVQNAPSHIDSAMVWCDDITGPGGVEIGQRHQMISMTAEFNPDPMPIHAMR